MEGDVPGNTSAFAARRDADQRRTNSRPLYEGFQDSDQATRLAQHSQGNHGSVLAIAHGPRIQPAKRSRTDTREELFSWHSSNSCLLQGKKTGGCHPGLARACASRSSDSPVSRRPTAWLSSAAQPPLRLMSTPGSWRSNPHATDLQARSCSWSVAERAARHAPHLEGDIFLRTATVAQRWSGNKLFLPRALADGHARCSGPDSFFPLPANEKEGGDVYT